MSGKILILSAAVIMFVTSCKKDANIAVNNSARTLDFKASASDTMQIALTIIRPSGLTTGVVGQEIAGFGSNDVVAPYGYKSTKIQTGDNVYIQIVTPSNKAITGSLTINGTSIPYTTLVNNPVVSGLTWNIYVK